MCCVLIENCDLKPVSGLIISAAKVCDKKLMAVEYLKSILLGSTGNE